MTNTRELPPGTMGFAQIIIKHEAGHWIARLGDPDKPDEEGLIIGLMNSGVKEAFPEHFKKWVAFIQDLGQAIVLEALKDEGITTEDVTTHAVFPEGFEL